MPCTEDVRNWCAYMQQFAHYSLSNEAWRSDCLRSHFILLNTINISCSPRKKKPIPILTVFFLFRSHLVSSRKKRTDDCRNRMCNHICNLFFFFLISTDFSVPFRYFCLQSWIFNFATNIFYTCPFTILVVIFRDALYDLWPHWIACTSYSIPLNAINVKCNCMDRKRPNCVLFLSLSLSQLLTH